MNKEIPLYAKTCGSDHILFLTLFVPALVFLCLLPQLWLILSHYLFLFVSIFFSVLVFFSSFLPPTLLSFLSVPPRPPNPLIPVCFYHTLTNQKIQLSKNLCVCVHFCTLCIKAFFLYFSMCLLACQCVHGLHVDLTQCQYHTLPHSLE